MKSVQQLRAAVVATDRARDAHEAVLASQNWTSAADCDEAERLEQAYLVVLKEYRAVAPDPIPTRVTMAPRGWSFHGSQLRHDELGTLMPERDAELDCVFVVHMSPAGSPTGEAFVGPAVEDCWKATRVCDAHPFSTRGAAENIAAHWRRTWGTLLGDSRISVVAVDISHVEHVQGHGANDLPEVCFG